jgi:hypothetical protein
MEASVKPIAANVDSTPTIVVKSTPTAVKSTPTAVKSTPTAVKSTPTPTKHFHSYLILYMCVQFPSGQNSDILTTYT